VNVKDINENMLKLAKRAGNEWDQFLSNETLNHPFSWQCIRFYRRDDVPGLLKTYLLGIAETLNELMHENIKLKETIKNNWGKSMKDKLISEQEMMLKEVRLSREEYEGKKEGYESLQNMGFCFVTIKDADGEK
jgi:hypothetical protein